MTNQTRVQARYREKQEKDRGLIRLTVWIPETARDKIIDLAAKLRRMAKEHDSK